MRAVALALALVASCGDAPFDYGDVTSDPELPPRGEDAIEPWLAAQHHRTWSCEVAPREPILVSPHGFARVCSNALVVASSGSVLPVGAATVKEIYEGDTLVGHAVSRKVTEDGLDGWYWYELQNGRHHADGMNTGSCPGCHQDAPVELTFVIVR